MIPVVSGWKFWVFVGVPWAVGVGTIVEWIVR